MSEAALIFNNVHIWQEKQRELCQRELIEIEKKAQQAMEDNRISEEFLSNNEASSAQQIGEYILDMPESVVRHVFSAAAAFNFDGCRYSLC